MELVKMLTPKAVSQNLMTLHPWEMGPGNLHFSSNCYQEILIISEAWWLLPQLGAL